MLQTYEPSHQSPPLLYNPTTSTVAPTQKSHITMSNPPPHNIFIVTGPAGSGKSTVAKFLADQLGFDYIEGDDYHPKANIEKMASGIPLNDADRWDWLILLRNESLASLAKGAKGVVVTCSALKQKYRDVIRTARFYDLGPTNVKFIYLQASKELLLARVRARQGHYMKDSMVISQLNSLEPPDEFETQRLKDIVCVEVSGTMAEVQQAAMNVVAQVLSEGTATAQL